MEIKLERAIIDQLSSKGILAYLAVRLVDGTEATTAALAALVRCQTAAMLEGLKELAVTAPGAVGKRDRKWVCGSVQVDGGDVILQNSDSERYRMFVDDLKKYWDFVNSNEIPFAMGSRDGIQIRNFLSVHKEWTEDDWRKALRNRARSVVNHQAASKTEPLWVWVSKLGTYASCEIDRFGKPVEGNGGKQGQIQQRNSEAAAAYVNGSRRTS